MRGGLGWLSGWWVPHRLLALWEAEDARASDGQGGSVWETENWLHLEELVREVEVEAGSRGPAQRPTALSRAPPGAADYAGVFMGMPSEAQSAAHAAPALLACPMPRPPPCDWPGRSGAQPAAGARARGGSTELTTPQPPPPEPPVGSPSSEAGQNAALPSTLPPWFRARLAAIVAAVAAVAIALALAEAGGEPGSLPPAQSPALERSVDIVLPVVPRGEGVRPSAGEGGTLEVTPKGAGKNGAAGANG